MEDKNGNLTYSNTRTKEEYFEILKLLTSYFITIGIWLFTIYIYKNFGRTWLLAGTSAMWIMGAITSFFIAGERDNTVKQTKLAILGYCLLLLLYRWVLQKISGINASSLSASLNISMSSTAGMAASGLLQNILIMISVMTPIGYLIWCGQKFKVFRITKTRKDELESLKNYKKGRRIK